MTYDEVFEQLRQKYGNHIEERLLEALARHVLDYGWGWINNVQADLVAYGSTCVGVADDGRVEHIPLKDIKLTDITEDAASRLATLILDAIETNRNGGTPGITRTQIMDAYYTVGGMGDSYRISDGVMDLARSYIDDEYTVFGWWTLDGERLEDMDADTVVTRLTDMVDAADDRIDELQARIDAADPDKAAAKLSREHNIDWAKAAERERLLKDEINRLREQVVYPPAIVTEFEPKSYTSWTFETDRGGCIFTTSQEPTPLGVPDGENGNDEKS